MFLSRSELWFFTYSMLKYVLIILAVMIVWVIAVFVVQKIINKEITDLKTAQVKINGTTIEAEIADGFLSRMRGLSGRESLGENKGMLFIFGNSAVQSFWMKDMNFAIDIIWFDNDKVVGFAENAQPPKDGNISSFRSPSAVNKVLEINAGSVKKLGIKIGDNILY